ncbi:hypothetical protein OTK49_02040 [Vibrio coralliirubri]|uniref:hypothetical protein n=1 Tax=Vibrio coralliirubri TaxID=1516159 RepID=UPI002283446F|nr:hypothetical protein [Vibrio coralliirubri]MCY9861295.1 hypothetical protein [Vibrio coralliirubri]
MARERKKPKERKQLISTQNTEHRIATQTNTPLQVCYSTQAAKFCATEFKREPEKAAAVKDALDRLSRSTMHGDSALVDGEKMELKFLKAGGLGALRARQLSINCGNDCIRMIICKHEDQIFIAKSFLKKDDRKDYVRHCSSAYDTIKVFIKTGVAAKHADVFPEDKAIKVAHNKSNQFKTKF